MANDQARILETFAEDQLEMRRSGRTEQTVELTMAFGAMRCAYCALRVVPDNGSQPIVSFSDPDNVLRRLQCHRHENYGRRV